MNWKTKTLPKGRGWLGRRGETCAEVPIIHAAGVHFAIEFPSYRTGHDWQGVPITHPILPALPTRVDKPRGSVSALRIAKPALRDRGLGGDRVASVTEAWKKVQLAVNTSESRNCEVARLDLKRTRGIPRAQSPVSVWRAEAGALSPDLRAEPVSRESSAAGLARAFEGGSSLRNSERPRSPSSLCVSAMNQICALRRQLSVSVVPAVPTVPG